MKFEKSDALKIKYRALAWLRLKQRCPFIATEVGAYNADVLGINETKIIECEVKQTLDDLKNDFKKLKHYWYKKDGEGEWERRWIPNRFYFALTPELVEPCKELLVKYDCEHYGIINLEGWSVVKRASKIHDREPSSKVKFICALRMGSELIRFHEAWL